MPPSMDESRPVLEPVQRVSEVMDAARDALAEELPPLIASHLRAQDVEFVRHALARLPEPASTALLTWQDAAGALLVALFALGALLPVLGPFVLIDDPVLALRVSNLLAVALLAAAGYELGRCAGEHPWRIASATFALGSAMVAVAIVLGG